MSDNKKWFKHWVSVLVDQSHCNLSLSEAGRWGRLMAHVTCSGERGKLIVKAPAKAFLLSLELTSLEDAIVALKRLPNVQIQYPLSDALNDNGSFIVIIKNWFKYQVDSTAYDRVKRSRYKKRGEEKRSITSTSTSTPRALRSPALAAGGATRETAKTAAEKEIDFEELEMRERNRQWQK